MTAKQRRAWASANYRARATWRRRGGSWFGIERFALDAPGFGIEPWAKVRMYAASLALDGFGVKDLP